MKKVPDTLITDRLILRRPAFSDAAAVYVYACDPQVARYMDWHIHTDIQNTVELLEKCVLRWKSGEKFCWIITVKPEDQAIGTIACRIEGYMADFGFVLNRSHWGKGYATEAVCTVVSWVMGLPGIYRIGAICDTENVASVQVLKKAGFLCEGILRCGIICPNLSPIPRDAFIFSKVRNMI